MEKTNYDYESKQALRQRIVNFIIRHYTRDERKNIRYICFPGFNEQTNSSLEITNIVDPLGIPRENVTGLEYNSEIYEKLAKAGLGIKLELTSDEEFFRNTAEHFNIISLDYTGMISRGFLELLSDFIFSRRILSTPGILATNFYGARDRRRIPVYYSARRTTEMAMSNLIAKSLDVEALLYFQEQMKELDKSRPNSLDDLRTSIPDLICSAATIGVVYATRQRIMERLKTFGLSDTELNERFRIKCRQLNKLYDDSSKKLPPFIGSFLQRRYENPFFLEDVESYKYVSDDGSPMISDLFFFNSHPEWFDEKKFPIEMYCPVSCQDFQSFADIFPTCEHSSYRIGDDDLEVLNPKFDPLLKKCMSQAHFVQTKRDVFARKVEYGKTERVFLGSSSKPIINLDKARELIENGVETRDILMNYRGVTKQQLAALKAWKTMRAEEQKINSI